MELVAPGVDVRSTVPYESEQHFHHRGTTVDAAWIDGAAHTDTDGVSGELVDGGLCTSGTAAFLGRIVLCQRGNITFADKVANVESAGGVAVVVYSNVNSDPSCAVFAGTVERLQPDPGGGHQL